VTQIRADDGVGAGSKSRVASSRLWILFTLNF
jgi:hypothetical protein